MARTSRNMMIERADEYRTLAVQRRNRGLHTGASAKGWNYTRTYEARDSWDEAVSIAAHGFAHSVSNARADYDWATRLGEIMGNSDDCPF